MFDLAHVFQLTVYSFNKLAFSQHNLVIGHQMKLNTKEKFILDLPNPVIPQTDERKPCEVTLSGELICDRRGKGIKEHLGVAITTVGKPKVSDEESKRRRTKCRFRR